MHVNVHAHLRSPLSFISLMLKPTLLAGFLEMFLWERTTQCLTLVIFGWVLLRLLRDLSGDPTYKKSTCFLVCC